MNDIVDSNLEKEKKIYEENRKRLGDKIFEIDSSITRYDENSNSKKSYITFDYFERSFSNAEKEYLKNAFLTYSSDEVKNILIIYSSLFFTIILFCNNAHLYFLRIL